MFWGLCQPLTARGRGRKHLGVASCGSFLHLSGIWCWQLWNIGTSWAFCSRLTRLCYWIWYLIIFLGTKLSFTEWCCEMVWYTKELAWNHQLYINSPSHPTKCHVRFHQKDWLFGWHASNRGCSVKLSFLIKNFWSRGLISVSAPLPLWVCSSSPPITWINPYRQLCDSQCCSSAACVL